MRDDPDLYAGAAARGPKPNAMPEDRFIVPSSRLFGDVDGAASQARKKDPNSLDSEKVKTLHQRLVSHYLRELDAQAPWRREMEKDAAYYDSDQWEPEDIVVLKSRGQEPMVFNVIAQSINWITGTEMRGRTDYKILPRNKEASKAAEHKSALFKYLDQVNMAEYHWSRSFADEVKVGLGWMELGIQDEDEGEPIYERYESWRNIIYDTSATEMDLQDGRYLFRSKWLDVDVAMALFPERKGVIEAAAYAVDEYGASLDRYGDEPMDSREEAVASEGYTSIDSPSYTRERIRVIEAWFRVPEEAERVKGGDFTGELYDPSSPGHVEQVDAGIAEVTRKLTYRMYVMLFVTTGPLWFSPSPYRHNRYPLTPLWAYRKDKDGSPYGVIRAMRDGQRDINKRFSKAQYILNSQKIIAEKGAVDDVDETLEEAARPDSYITINPGKRFEMSVDRELSQAHLELMQVSNQMIQSLSGVTDESLGRTTNAVSGKAIIARQDQGALATAKLFDNLRLARAFHGEKKLSVIEQFMTKRKQFRITNARGNPDYITINDDLPENDIVRTKADFIVSEEDWTASIRQAQVEALLQVVVQLAGAAPQLALVMLDLIIDAMDIPNREEIVKRIRNVTGAEDPDADPDNPTPEMIAKQAAQAKQAAMEERAAEANVAKLEGEAAEKQARAAKAKADAEKVIRSLPKDNLDNYTAAFQLAVQILTAAGAVDTADALLVAAEGMGGGGLEAGAAPVPTGPAPVMPGAQPQPAMPPMPQGMPA